jgi:sec-independent protein translocase protein TatB
MFNMGFSELVVLAIIGLLVIGPEQLPVVARKVARVLNDFKRTTDEVFNPVDEFKRRTEEYVNRPLIPEKESRPGQHQSQEDLPVGEANNLEDRKDG